MSHESAKKLIEHMLTLSMKNRKFDTSGECLAWERGYLTGFLIDLILDDFYAYEKLQKKIKKLEERR